MRLQEVFNIVVPPDRIRKDFDGEGLHELADSIAVHGLFHPLLLRDDGVTLVAGERRLRAVSKLTDAKIQFAHDGHQVPLGKVPVVRLGDSDAAALLEAELQENSIRRNLSWQEQARATAALFKLKATRDTSYTMRQLAIDTHGGDPSAAKLGGDTHNSLSSDLTVAEFLDDPEVSKCKTRKEALAVVERKLVGLHRERLAAEFGAISQSADHKLIKGDMFSVLPTFPDKYFDVIIADPPYGIDADLMANQGAVPHAYKDPLELSQRIYQFIASEGWRLCKAEAHAYIFCDPKRAGTVGGILASAGWYVWPWPLIWCKAATNIGLLPRPEHGPRRTYETLVYAIKGDRRVTGVYPDCIVCPHDRSTERGAHKPAALYADLIARSCFPGDRVLDPCCGTGPIFDAGKSQHVFAVGVEIEDAAYGQSLQRIKGE